MQVKPIKIVILYLLFSIGWILFGDRLISILSSLFSAVRYENLRMLKSIFFILCTAGLLYFAIKKQQKSLLNSEKQYKNLFYSNPLPMWIYDQLTLRFLDVNDAAVRAYGYSTEEFKMLTILDIRKRSDHAEVMKSVKKVTEHSNPTSDWEHYKKNGVKITARITSHRLLFNNREAVMVMAQDVTVQRQKEEELKLLYSTEKELKEELEKNIKLIEQSMQEKLRLAEVIDRIHNMVVITNPFGIIIWVNQAFTNFTGYSAEEVAGQTTNLLHGPNTDPEMQFKIMEAVKHKDFSTFEILNYSKTGQEYWVEISISAIYNEEKEIVRYISIQNIITERRLNEIKLKQQNVVLKRLAWINSHGIRKPIASILSLVDLSKDIADLEEIREIHHLIGLCSKELDEITKEVGKAMGSSLFDHKNSV